jgi:DNA invertase Pin-like site-specific DNA recombinase
MPRVSLDPPLRPKNGSVLKVLGIDRISTKNQDPKSNADQEALLHRWLEDRYDGSTEWFRITGQGSGECIDRQQVRDAEDLVANGDIDVVIMEDLGRHLRRAQAVGFCEQCEDSDTRLIAINDNIDTYKDWRLHAFFAAIKHEQSNKDTSERIKRSLRNRFNNGEALSCLIFGYIKPPGAKSDSELYKDPTAEPIYERWFCMLENGASYAEVADWLNAENVPTGPYCDTDEWNGPMVSEITHNTILKGLRVRNNRKSKRNNKSGKYISVKSDPTNRNTRTTKRPLQAWRGQSCSSHCWPAEETHYLAGTASLLWHLRAVIPVWRSWPERSPDVPRRARVPLLERDHGRRSARGGKTLGCHLGCHRDAGRF